MFDFANRRFALQENASGHAADNTVMTFGPERFPWRATYSGSNVNHGQVLLNRDGDQVRMTYHACSSDGQLSAGEAQVRVHPGEPNRMTLDWRWLSGNTGNGQSDWQEVPNEPVQRSRSAAYALITQGRPDAREILLCRISDQLPHSAGRWTLPGGGIEFGEHPEQAMMREVAEETGLQVGSPSLQGVDSWVVEQNQVSFHALGYIYTAQVTGGELIDEIDGTTDLAAWHRLSDIANLPTVGLVHKGIKWLAD